ncbi:pancreatic secretory granule membrane major glycoprotein GP2-like isoform X2 [Hyla sarda]|nr:pancreatic secretory granule membrane major glycoprotein GP2-like isoform X2 [Hyla sarda]XP_056413431.1 pancreatic secretory granule membrane major glycoprotein GP2-like isoform X2 [Hyla sarda]
MKSFLALLVALSTVLSVYASEQLCEGSVDCNCDLSKYNSSVIPPNPTVNCSNGEMTIYISKCQLQKNLFNTSNLALNNLTGSECASRDYLVDGEVQVGFHNPMNTAKCGNTLLVNATHIIYSNILHIYAEQRTIVSRNNATVNLSCAYPLSFPVSLNVTLKPITGITGLSVPGVTGSFPITMAAFTDSSFTVPVTADTVLLVEQVIYIQVWIPNLQADSFAVKVIRLYATPGGSTPQDGLIFNLTSGIDGCPDPTYGDQISVLQNGNGSLTRFALKVFKITGQDLLNLYADVTICTSACEANCIKKDLGSSAPENVATVRLPLEAQSDPTSGATDRFSLSWTLVSLISSLLFAKFM